MMMNEKKISSACEADVLGSLSCNILNQLNNKPSLLVDIVDLDSYFCDGKVCSFYKNIGSQYIPKKFDGDHLSLFASEDITDYFKIKLNEYINMKYLKLKIALVSTLIIVAVFSIPIISLPGNDFFGFNLKFFKHALEWDYFLGVITFYMLTYLMWKKN